MANYPATPVPARITLGAFSPTLVSTSHSLRRQVRSRGGQLWRVRLDYPPMSRADLAELWAFLVSLRGSAGNCDFSLPVLSTKQGAGGGTPKILNRSNFCKYSEDYTESVWTKTSSVDAGVTTVAPDLGQISGLNDEAQAFNSTITGWGRFEQWPTRVMANNNLLSVYVKWRDAPRTGLNLYNNTAVSSCAAYCNWHPSNGNITSMTNTSADDCGYAADDS